VIDLRPDLVAVGLLDAEVAEVEADWRELCRWDPELPPDAEPVDPAPVVRAVVDAMRRPQPLGLGVDPQVEAAVEALTERAGPVAVGQLVCLREAVTRRLRGRVPAQEAEETWSRLQMTVDRAVACAARRSMEQLSREACADGLTGVLNRRAFERDLRRELGRSLRHGGAFTLVMVDVDGLKALNDSHGHSAGDDLLRSVAAALSTAVRREDAVYRLGGDEFAVLLSATEADQAEVFMVRVARPETPGGSFSWGAASYPLDGKTPDQLVEMADARLYADKALRRRARGTTGPTAA
jgi:diguanylate cyclase (GGDEF)-like protein